MRATRRLLAVVYKNTKPVKGSGQYLTAYNPTGLTGVPTHPYPRPTLLHLYSSTLKTLSQIPASSVYRQAVEALTKQRLAVVEGTLPPGFETWKRGNAQLLQEHPELAGTSRSFTAADGATYLIPQDEYRVDDRVVEWDGEGSGPERGEGPRAAGERQMQAREFGKGRPVNDLSGKDVTIVNEPPLTADQVNSIEQQIGAGLIEEIIAVAEGELHLAQTMLESKAWEELEEKPTDGQWAYFSRDTHTKTTQAP